MNAPEAFIHAGSGSLAVPAPALSGRHEAIQEHWMPSNGSQINPWWYTDAARRAKKEILDNDEMKQFFLKLIPPRPTFAEDMTDAERKFMQEHAAYWKDLCEKGMAIVYGPVFDPKGAWGIGVVESESEEEAHALGANDPTIKANVGFTLEIYPMRVAMVRK